MCFAFCERDSDFMLASMRQHLSEWFQTRPDSNQPPQLQRLARDFRINLWHMLLPKTYNKDANKISPMRRLGYAFAVRKHENTDFLAIGSQYIINIAYSIMY